MKTDDSYRKQVLKTFFKNGMLLKIPVQNRKKDVVLHKIATKLVPEKMYSEAELEDILKKIHPEFEKLKVDLSTSRFIKKTKGQYHLT